MKVIVRVSQAAALCALLLVISCSDMDVGTLVGRYYFSADTTVGLFCETAPLGVNWNVDTKLDIWYDANGGMALEETGGAPGGSVCWKMTGLSNWMGFGIRTEPLTNYRNLYKFRKGRLHFFFKGTKGFKVGVKSTIDASGEAWITSSRLVSYGLKLDGTWSEVNVPMSVLRSINTNLNLSNVNQYFMWVADAGFGYVPGDVYYLDEIFWRSDYTGPTNDSYEATNYGLFSDSIENGVIWDNNCKLDVWADYGAAMELTNVTNMNGEGLNSWKMTGTGSWMGMSIRVNPLGEYADMSEYSLGSLRFLARGTNSFKIGIKSGSGTEVWKSPSALSNYGYVPDGSWKTVLIPLEDFSGIDFTHISQYFMFVSDGPLGYTNGIVFYLDHIYWSKLTN